MNTPESLRRLDENSWKDELASADNRELYPNRNDPRDYGEYGKKLLDAETPAEEASKDSIPPLSGFMYGLPPDTNRSTYTENISKIRKEIRELNSRTPKGQSGADL